MSVDNLKEYARRCATEPELATEAKAIGVSDIEGQMRYAASLDLAWTEDDLAAFREEMVDAEGDIADLSEDDLDNVAGGVATVTAVAVSVGVAVTAGSGSW